MAGTINNLQASPSSGSNNQTISVTASANTGRSAKSSALSVQGTGVQARTVTVNQQGATEFITVTSATPSVENSATSYTIQGKSNSPSLTFAKGMASQHNIENFVIKPSYTAAGISTTNGQNITGDPGADSEYSFSMDVTFDANDTIEDLTAVVIITGSTSSVTKTVTLTQSANSPYVWIDEVDTTSGTITLPAAGTAKTFKVLSNTSWTITEQ